ncbi:hypothetical protein ABZ656_13025 [Streptomyces sp. NPDC007095]|uniref:hypothetical protein n=1 Tax=Streptomyces sp. NPDC007095 TaxID=3154482 RepID=UPI0033D1D07C
MKANSEPPSVFGTSLTTRTRSSYVLVSPGFNGGASILPEPSSGCHPPSAVRASTFTKSLMSASSGSSVWSQG